MSSYIATRLLKKIACLLYLQNLSIFVAEDMLFSRRHHGEDLLSPINLSVIIMILNRTDIKIWNTLMSQYSMRVLKGNIKEASVKRDFKYFNFAVLVHLKSYVLFV